MWGNAAAEIGKCEIPCHDGLVAGNYFIISPEIMHFFSEIIFFVAAPYVCADWRSMNWSVLSILAFAASLTLIGLALLDVLK
jgi:hypothetical protein